MRGLSRPIAVALALLVAAPPACIAWTVPWGGAAAASREASRRNFDALADSCQVRVYARAGKSCQAGRDASGQREASDPRPWNYLGLVAAHDPSAIDAAISAQRSILEAEARRQHPALRPHRSLMLAWQPGEKDPAPMPTLGSYLCPRCGTLVPAAAEKASCGAARPEWAPQGELTLAKRVTAAGVGESGFCPVGDSVQPRDGRET